MTLSIGQEAPDFELVGTPPEPLRLSTLRGRRIAVIAFYELAFNDGCTAELQEFQELLPQFEEAGAEVIGISLDPKGVNDAFAASNGFAFPLLSDTFQHEVCTLYQAWRANRGFASGQGGIAERVTYVVDKEGIIRGAITSVADVRDHAHEALRVVQASR